MRTFSRSECLKAATVRCWARFPNGWMQPPPSARQGHSSQNCASCLFVIHLLSVSWCATHHSNPVPFPLSANPWLMWWMNCRTLNARLASKKIHPGSGCSQWHGLHHDSGRRCPIREGSQGTFHHEEHWSNSLRPSLLQGKCPGQEWTFQVVASKSTALESTFFPIRAWIATKSFIKLIPLVENGSMVHTTGLENPSSSLRPALVCATPALGTQAGQELLPQKKLGHPDQPLMGGN